MFCSNAYNDHCHVVCYFRVSLFRLLLMPTIGLKQYLRGRLSGFLPLVSPFVFFVFSTLLSYKVSSHDPGILWDILFLTSFSLSPLPPTQTPLRSSSTFKKSSTAASSNEPLLLQLVLLWFSYRSAVWEEWMFICIYFFRDVFFVSVQTRLSVKIDFILPLL